MKCQIKTCDEKRLEGLVLGKWKTYKTLFSSATPCIAGISGGRTSAMMASLLPEKCIFTFQNTSLEHAKTYDFLVRLEGALEHKIHWLEYVPPPKYGRPSEMSFRIVDRKTANYDGQPFRDLLDSFADFRATKGLKPIAPWARQRLCTAYLKLKVKDRFIRSLGWSVYTEFVGIRYDEPERLNFKQSRNREIRAPLADSKIVKQDVIDFWNLQDFDLDIPENLGNCTGCFLKNQSELSRALHNPESLPDIWVSLERKYQGFGGVRFVGYEQLQKEAPLRIRIEQDLRNGIMPSNDNSVSEDRFKLIVAQEKFRLKAGNKYSSISCNCEGATTLSEAEEELEEDIILSLPGE